MLKQEVETVGIEQELGTEVALNLAEGDFRTVLGKLSVDYFRRSRYQRFRLLDRHRGWGGYKKKISHRDKMTKINSQDGMAVASSEVKNEVVIFAFFEGETLGSITEDNSRSALIYALLVRSILGTCE